MTASSLKRPMARTTAIATRRTSADDAVLCARAGWSECQPLSVGRAGHEPRAFNIVVAERQAVVVTEIKLREVTSKVVLADVVIPSAFSVARANRQPPDRKRDFTVGRWTTTRPPKSGSSARVAKWPASI